MVHVDNTNYGNVDEIENMKRLVDGNESIRLVLFDSFAQIFLQKVRNNILWCIQEQFSMVNWKQGTYYIYSIAINIAHKYVARNIACLLINK